MMSKEQQHTEGAQQRSSSASAEEEQGYKKSFGLAVPASEMAALRDVGLALTREVKKTERHKVELEVLAHLYILELGLRGRFLSSRSQQAATKADRHAIRQALRALGRDPEEWGDRTRFESNFAQLFDEGKLEDAFISCDAEITPESLRDAAPFGVLLTACGVRFGVDELAPQFAVVEALLVASLLSFAEYLGASGVGPVGNLLRVPDFYAEMRELCALPIRHRAREFMEACGAPTALGEPRSQLLFEQASTVRDAIAAEAGSPPMWLSPAPSHSVLLAIALRVSSARARKDVRRGLMKPGPATEKALRKLKAERKEARGVGIVGGVLGSPAPAPEPAPEAQTGTLMPFNPDPDSIWIERFKAFRAKGMDLKQATEAANSDLLGPAREPKRPALVDSDHDNDDDEDDEAGRRREALRRRVRRKHRKAAKLHARAARLARDEEGSESGATSLSQSSSSSTSESSSESSDEEDGFIAPEGRPRERYADVLDFCEARLKRKMERLRKRRQRREHKRRERLIEREVRKRLRVRLADELERYGIDYDSSEDTRSSPKRRRLVRGGSD